jgi:hypothetical protein
VVCVHNHNSDAIFAKAGTRQLPIVFIDDKYQGDYDAMVRLNESGQLDKLLQTMKHAPLLVIHLLFFLVSFPFLLTLQLSYHRLAQRQETKAWAIGGSSSSSGGTGSASTGKGGAAPVAAKIASPSPSSTTPTRPTPVAAKIASPATLPSPAQAPSKAAGGKFCTSCGILLEFYPLISLIDASLAISWVANIPLLLSDLQIGTTLSGAKFCTSCGAKQ